MHLDGSGRARNKCDQFLWNKWSTKRLTQCVSLITKLTISFESIWSRLRFMPANSVQNHFEIVSYFVSTLAKRSFHIHSPLKWPSALKLPRISRTMHSSSVSATSRVQRYRWWIFVPRFQWKMKNEKKNRERKKRIHTIERNVWTKNYDFCSVFPTFRMVRSEWVLRTTLSILCFAHTNTYMVLECILDLWICTIWL